MQEEKREDASAQALAPTADSLAIVVSSSSAPPPVPWTNRSVIIAPQVPASSDFKPNRNFKVLPDVPLSAVVKPPINGMPADPRNALMRFLARGVGGEYVSREWSKVYAAVSMILARPYIPKPRNGIANKQSFSESQVSVSIGRDQGTLYITTPVLCHRGGMICGMGGRFKGSGDDYTRKGYVQASPLSDAADRPLETKDGERFLEFEEIFADIVSAQMALSPLVMQQWKDNFLLRWQRENNREETKMTEDMIKKLTLDLICEFRHAAWGSTNYDKHPHVDSVTTPLCVHEPLLTDGEGVTKFTAEFWTYPQNSEVKKIPMDENFTKEQAVAHMKLQGSEYTPVLIFRRQAVIDPVTGKECKDAEGNVRRETVAVEYDSWDSQNCPVQPGDWCRYTYEIRTKSLLPKDNNQGSCSMKKILKSIEIVRNVDHSHEYKHAAAPEGFSYDFERDLDKQAALAAHDEQKELTNGDHAEHENGRAQLAVVQPVPAVPDAPVTPELPSDSEKRSLSRDVEDAVSLKKPRVHSGEVEREKPRPAKVMRAKTVAPAAKKQHDEMEDAS